MKTYTRTLVAFYKKRQNLNQQITLEKVLKRNFNHIMANVSTEQE